MNNFVEPTQAISIAASGFMVDQLVKRSAELAAFLNTYSAIAPT